MTVGINNLLNLDLNPYTYLVLVFTKSLCQLMEVITGPLMHSLESRCIRNKRKIEELKQRKNELEQKLKESGKWSPIKTSVV